MLKYDPLQKYLSRQTDSRITLKFNEIETIIGDRLPPSAYKYSVWWSNSTTKAHPYSYAWTDAGFFTVDVCSTIYKEQITFEKR